MKKLYLLLLSALSVSVVFGQHENAFIKEGKMWNIVFSIRGISDSRPEKSELVYVMMGDTLISEKQYKKFYMIGDSTVSKPLTQNYLLMGFFREENQKVWFMPLETSRGGEQTRLDEYLMYDFSAQRGDIIEIGECVIHSYGLYTEIYGGGSYNELVQVKDIVVGPTGRRRILVGPVDIEWVQYEWIEEIGTEAGLFWQNIERTVDGVERRAELRCVKENEKIIYLDSDCDKCINEPTQIYVVVGLESPATFQPKVTLSPNPVRNDLNITVSDDMLPCVMNVFTPTGEYVTGKKLTKAQDQLSMMGMNAGLYLYRVTTDSGALLDSGKVIRE